MSVNFANYVNPLTLQVIHAVAHTQGAPRRPTVGVAEAIAMTIMAAVPEMAMAVVTITAAVGVSRTLVAVQSAQPGKTWKEDTPLVITAARAEVHLGAAEPIGAIEE